MNFVKKSNAEFLLLFNAFLWGSSYVWSKMLLGFLSRFSILFLCALGGLVSTVIMFYPSIKNIKRNAVIPSVLVSCLSIASNTFFMFALRYTSSSNTAFIVQLSVIITPILMSLLEKRLPKVKTIIGAFIAIVGLFLLTTDFSAFTLKIGDLLALGNAIFFSLFLVALNINSKKVDPVHFTLVHHTTNTIGFLILAGIFESRTIEIHTMFNPVFDLLIAASIFVSVVTILLQSAAIKYVRPEKATLIYTFEPVTTLFLGFLVLGEKLSGLMPAAGCILILISVVFSIFGKGVDGNKFNALEG